MPSLAVLYDPAVKSWLRFTDPVEEIKVDRLDEVLPALAHLENRVELEGLYAAGFISYEAASAFDDALHTLPAGDFPLLRFGLFNTPEQFTLPAPEQQPQNIDWQTDTSAEIFAEKINQIHAAIARGETYQVNLTFPLTGKTEQEPWHLFLQLVQGQEPTSCGFLQSDQWAICSASPELFFSRTGSRLTMRPMKGTAPRGRTLSEDQSNAAELQKSEKNRAENIMILDMVRNDLGRLAPPGQVQTEAICTLEKYPTVWQLTSTVTARSNASMADIFRAVFPCASITGAPKAQTMQIITEQESVPRNIYTGTFGWMAPGRKAHFNVAIRTALINRMQQQATYGVGAGITWGSDSAEEYRECLDKAAVLSRSHQDFALIETLRWTPGKGYFLQEEHLQRLQNSAVYFDFEFDLQKAIAYLEQLADQYPQSPQRIRLLLHQDGRFENSYRALANERKGSTAIRFAKKPINRDNILLFHKTTQRELYDRCLADAGDAHEVVLWNEQGEVTECCTANIVIEKDGRLLTPTSTCGLLPGTYRNYLLNKGIITEAVISKEDLHRCSSIFLINAVRKWRRAIFVKNE